MGQAERRSDANCSLTRKPAQMQVSQDDLDTLLDHADDVSRAAWIKLSGHDATAALHVIGTLIAATEKQLGWSRQEILDAVSEVADACRKLN